MNNLSYWEQTTWLSNIDYAIIGSGIVGLSCALELRKLYPEAKIVVFEKGVLPQGASTKNAGFACFGSISEIIEDLKTHSEEEVIALVKSRVEGLELLRENLGDEAIDFQINGGYELFNLEDEELFETCISKLNYVNDLLGGIFFNKSSILGKNDVFLVKKDPFSFKNVQNKLIFNQFEGQLDTGKMMNALIQKTSKNGILLINNVKIDSFLTENDQILLKTSNFDDFKVKNLIIANNGFAKQFVDANLEPARAQVLITEPIANLDIKGTFHLDKGYYYFRNIHNRILLGGGRNLDFQGENTQEMGLTTLVQSKLEELLHTTILPGKTFKIDSRWSGIMGVGDQKKPIVKQIAPNVYCGIRLGGMGVAIGSSIGKQLANLVES
ncbi:MAG: FAD-binding oxidoreductase [Flavobacteriaceae bacterium]|nr:FAD-binding oxidoreductase [Flavobacteriaceae bacterium]